ncbi:MAG: carboxypeptidase regulatory-like domain-containing protein, partial [Pyrinomonadaceae bacterium]
MRSNLQSVFIMFICAIFLVSGALAQTGASVSGVVSDQAGGVIPGATVKIISIATGAERTTTTSTDGYYAFQQLPPGGYNITVTNEGFKTSRLDAIEIGAGQTRTIDVPLETGALEAIVDITSNGSNPASIDQSSNRLGVNISAKEVEELPVNGRNYSQLYLNAPGATNTGTGNFGDLRFNGRANQQNQTKLDGIESTAIFDASPGYVTVQGSQFRLQTSIENIQEFCVDSSNYPAEYGTGTGGQINVIGKSGGNAFSDSLFYYIRNYAFDARNFCDGAEKSPLRLNQFGGSLGGPIVK